MSVASDLTQMLALGTPYAEGMLIPIGKRGPDIESDFYQIFVNTIVDGRVHAVFYLNGDKPRSPLLNRIFENQEQFQLAKKLFLKHWKTILKERQ